IMISNKPIKYIISIMIREFVSKYTEKYIVIKPIPNSPKSPRILTRISPNKNNVANPVITKPIQSYAKIPNLLILLLSVYIHTSYLIKCFIMMGFSIDFIKKTCLHLCFILLVMSIYKDLSSEIPSEDPNKYETLDEYSTDFTLIKVKVQPGDTVLSIVEEVNGQIQESSIEKVDRKSVV